MLVGKVYSTHVFKHPLMMFVVTLGLLYITERGTRGIFVYVLKYFSIGW